MMAIRMTVTNTRTRASQDLILKRVESEKDYMGHSIGHSAQVLTDLECSFGYDDIATLSKSRVIVLRASPP